MRDAIEVTRNNSTTFENLATFWSDCVVVDDIDKGGDGILLRGSWESSQKSFREIKPEEEGATSATTPVAAVTAAAAA